MSLPTVLRRIVEGREQSFAEQARIHSRDPPLCRDPPSLISSIESNRGRAIIAEIKRAAPSAAGSFVPTEVPVRAKAYHSAGVAGISVLCEPDYFSGSYSDLSAAARSTPLPVLCKDFVVSPGQLELARHLGASAALIIVKVKESVALLDRCIALGLEPLLEIHDEADLDVVTRLASKRPGLRLVGVNNRDLDTLKVSLATGEELIPRVKQRMDNDPLVVAESGINCREDIESLGDAGADAFLVGTLFMRHGTGETGALVQQLLG